MSAFGDAADVMFSDPNMSTAATYRAGGLGTGTAVTVLFSRPMRDAAFGTSGAIVREIVARVRLSEIPAAKRGDTLEIASVLYKVEEALPDGIDCISKLTLV